MVYTAKAMRRDYIQTALERAHHELIEGEEPFYGEIPELAGVWPTGKTLEACRSNLESAIEGWVLVRISRGLEVPSVGGVSVSAPREMGVV